jgi:hypothetical protein
VLRRVTASTTAPSVAGAFASNNMNLLMKQTPDLTIVAPIIRP